MSQTAPPAQGDPNAPAGVSVRAVLVAAVVGTAFFYLLQPIHSLLASWRLPASYLTFWSDWPLLGGWLLSALRSLLSYWLLALLLALPLAWHVRREFVFYGAVASGMYLLLDAQTGIDGWQSWWQVGPDYWLAHKLDLMQSDPFGVIGRWLAIPVCTLWWGAALTSRASVKK